jgi:hypothetical protein
MEKPFVKIVFNDGRFRYKEANTEEMSNLGFFLATDVGCYSKHYREWVLDENMSGFGGNFSNVDKEGDYLFIGCEFSEEKDRGPYLKIHRDELIKILDTWEQFCKTRPKEILITQDGETFTIESKG